jgi:hypothetical protein
MIYIYVYYICMATNIYVYNICVLNAAPPWLMQGGEAHKQCEVRESIGKVFRERASARKRGRAGGEIRAVVVVGATELPKTKIHRKLRLVWVRGIQTVSLSHTHTHLHTHHHHHHHHHHHRQESIAASLVEPRHFLRVHTHTFMFILLDPRLQAHEEASAEEHRTGPGESVVYWYSIQ